MGIADKLNSLKDLDISSLMGGGLGDIMKPPAASKPVGDGKPGADGVKSPSFGNFNNDTGNSPP